MKNTHPRTTSCFVLAVGCFAVISDCHANEPAHSADSAVAALQLADDSLTVELVASEPTIVDPVAGRFDERGRLWVVEMRDYPTGPAEGEDPNGRIVILTDTDGDGFFESSTTFADNLLFPTGLQPWKGGAFVTLAGEIAYFHDEDRDGVSERKETWFTGFAEENEQLRANHPTLGPDGMIYVPCGLRGGEIRDARPGHENALSVSTNGRDFRFDPNGRRFEAVAGRGQFGLTFDEYGRRFVCMNAAPLDHVVMEEATLGRNKNFADSTTIEHVIPGGQSEPVFPLVEQWTTSTFHKGSWTAACGVHIHRGDRLGEEADGNAFICEPTGALVHREILADDGPTFAGRPAYEGREFLASTDIWFRPVNLFDGPDGALYVVDMARKEIEHPQWLPPEARDRYDFVSGNTLGRIYRVSKPGGPRGVHSESFEESRSDGVGPLSPVLRAYNAARHLVDLNSMTNVELRGVLTTTKSSWLRGTCFRLMLERQFIANVPHEGEVRRHMTKAGELAFLNAKAACDTLAAADLSEAFRNANPRLHEQASRLARRHFPGDASLADHLVLASRSTDSKVAFQAAISLGSYANDTSLDALVALAVRDGSNPWMRRAVLSSIRDAEVDFATRILDQSSNAELVESAFALAIRATTNARQTDANDPSQIVRSITQSSAASEIRRAALLGLATAIKRPDAYRLLDDAPAFRDKLTSDALESLRAGDAKAAEFIGWYHPPSDMWSRILTEPIPAEARSTLVTRLARRSDFPASDAFLASLGEMPPSLRAGVLNAMQARPSLARALLDAAQSRVLPVSLIDNTTADRLRKHRDESVAALAKKVLPKRNANRVAVVDQYKPCLELDCEIGVGAAAFKKHCATCHRVGDDGGNVGPDLSDLRTKTPDQILQAILDPNAAIDANYINHTAITLDGQVVSGLLVSQSESAVTLRGSDAKDVTILRTELESVAPTGQSIMPEGLERQLDQQAMADVIYFLKNWRYVAER